MVPRDPASDSNLANTLRLLLAWTFPRNVSAGYSCFKVTFMCFSLSS